MRSALYTTEIVPNRNRRFGAATTYYPCQLVRADGSKAAMLFTDAELAVAVERARGNGEDVDAAVRAEDAARRALWRAAVVLGVAIALAGATLLGALAWRV